jgi:hypothetical protein
MSFPLVDRNNSLETLVINDGVIKGLIGQKLEGCKSKNSLGKEEDAGDICFKIPKTFPLVEPSLQNFFLIISLAIDRHCKINKRKRGNIERNKLKKEENYITLCEDARYN